ncbi:alpha/beta-hydrolase [Pleomassaria siparia CBS 279.74]|uniref:Alpha/beta-hydrolase n=1 Tax=Pleomassaria siparia CBS 279.74 TaxID=1314801 RepID=A0A6G1KB45_9PLEO|nr:alpha/beta-hydrolase [Pleomassaria siparia CBS 279.74]
MADQLGIILQVEHQAKRDHFYVGGSYKDIRVGNETKQFMLNQIYVEKLTPRHPTQPFPLIFIAGAGQTGTNFLTTPDGRPGWSHFFLSHGYTIYLTDQPSRGRSAFHPSMKMNTSSTSDVETYFTATSEHGLWPQAKLHTQWPGTGKVGDPIFDAFYASQVPSVVGRSISEDQNAKAYTALIDRVGKAYLITHSQAGAFGWRVGDARPNLVQGIVAIEPSGPPFLAQPPFLGEYRAWGLTNFEIEYQPTAGPNGEYLKIVKTPTKDAEHWEYMMQEEPAKQLVNLSKVPMLVVTGEASMHAPYDYATVEYLRQAGVAVEFADLGAEGIHGNGHMLFMEKNNLVIAERVLGWLRTHNEDPRGQV